MCQLRSSDGDQSRQTLLDDTKALSEQKSLYTPCSGPNHEINPWYERLTALPVLILAFVLMQSGARFTIRMQYVPMLRG